MMLRKVAPFEDENELNLSEFFLIAHNKSLMLQSCKPFFRAKPNIW